MRIEHMLPAAMPLSCLYFAFASFFTIADFIRSFFFRLFFAAISDFHFRRPPPRQGVSASRAAADFAFDAGSAAAAASSFHVCRCLPAAFARLFRAAAPRLMMRDFTLFHYHLRRACCLL